MLYLYSPYTPSLCVQWLLYSSLHLNNSDEKQAPWIFPTSVSCIKCLAKDKAMRSPLTCDGSRWSDIFFTTRKINKLLETQRTNKNGPEQTRTVQANIQTNDTHVSCNQASVLPYHQLKLSTYCLFSNWNKKTPCFTHTLYQYLPHGSPQQTAMSCKTANLLKTKRNLLYIRNQSVPRCKHFPPRL